MSMDSTKSVMGQVKTHLCFCIRWDLWVTQCIPVCPQRESRHYFSCLDGTGTDSRKSTPRHVTPNLCVASGGICGPRSAFRCVWDAKRQRAIFHGRVGRVGFYKMCDGTPYAKLLFLHPMGYAGHVVHCGASGLRNTDVLFFMLGWDRYGLQKQHVETRSAEFVYCIRWDLWVT
jgi:hypothetical protein